MAKIKISFEAKSNKAYEDEQTIEIHAEESSTYRDSIELYIEGTYVHIDKEELKKVVTLLCE